MNRELFEEGKVVEILPSAQYRLELRDGKTIRAYLCGKMRMHHIKVILGDRVSVLVSGEIGRIMRRL